jgi:hypothetical protein
MIDNHRNGICVSPSAALDAGAEGLYARPNSHLAAWTRARRRARRAQTRRTRDRRGWASDPEGSPGTGPGKFSSSHAAGVHRSRLISETPRPDFLLSQNFSTARNANAQGTRYGNEDRSCAIPGRTALARSSRLIDRVGDRTTIRPQLAGRKHRMSSRPRRCGSRRTTTGRLIQPSSTTEVA